MREIKTAFLLAVLLLTACGKVGPQGIDGRPGAPGAKGDNGQNATPCHAEAIADGVRLSCPDGSTETVYNGSQGPAGANGMVTSVVQFCPSYGPTTYPNNFPEYGICIANQLFAVYWTGSQAFLALIPPGRYSSTSPQGCSFQVLPDCQVSP